MDNSQNSDVLSRSTDLFFNTPSDPMVMDTITYDSLVSSTTLAFSSIQNDVEKSSFSSYFSTLLEDCSACIYQSLDLITELLLTPDLEIHKLKEYMSNAVNILQLLADLIKNVIESVTMTCHSMKTFPKAVGRIISQVFAHCKDSESLYGVSLNIVENELKDLFRTCHELQLTYLMVLEKHFIFDLVKTEEQDILIEALEINLKIGEIVQSLDVKTMAVQWKAYTILCEKYANSLLEKDIICDCTTVLCTMLTNNMKTALEENEDNKTIVRSLKVGSFTIKILLRVCNIFKYAVKKDHGQILELLLLIFLNNEAYLEATSEKSPQFMNLFATHISGPATCLLTELTLDKKFVNYILNYDINKIRSEDKLLGYILTTVSVTKILLQRNDDQIAKQRIINCIYRFLPLCHVWFNMDLKFKSNPNQTHGLYEQLVTHTIALVVTMDSEGINVLEKRMIEAVLGTDCYSAMFSSNLWTLLARMSSRQLLLNQVTSLIKMYRKLENNPLFPDSPQQVHLSYTMKRLFDTMTHEDRMKVYNMFRIQEDKNIGVWSVLGLNNLPRELHSNVNQFVVDKIKKTFRKLESNEIVDIDEVNKILNLAHVRMNTSRDHELEDLLIKAWMKTCPKDNPHVAETLNKGTMWYFRYIKGLVSVINSMKDVQGEKLVKVLRSISSVVQFGSTELKLLIIHILCKLANLPMSVAIQNSVEPILIQTFDQLFRDTDVMVRNKLYNELRGPRNSYLDSIIDRVHDLSDAFWAHFKTHGTLNRDSDVDLKQHLLPAMELEYLHKCIENGEIIQIIDSGSDVAVVTKAKSNSSNFDFADINTLFETENDAEPVSKKAKLASDDVVDEIISRLEADAHSLSKIKENVFTGEYQKKIKKICNKLINITEA